VPGVSNNPYYHVLHDIQDRGRYLLGGCVEDLWLGVSALLALFPRVAGRVAYQGISFGGGIGALAAPWDPRIAALQLEVPSFGHQPLRLELPCIGSAEAVRGFQRHHSDLNVMETLAYYDAATAARFLSVPTLVAAALFDPVVPPPGQFAIHNAIPAPLRRLFVLEAGHFEYPSKQAQHAQLDRAVADFLMETCPVP
jgi:cephalosporin-C deacetylase